LKTFRVYVGQNSLANSTVIRRSANH
jgi:hypothetical protein